ncbi:MFS transporter [Pseudonocardia sp. GCM10023141]|uniref:MFS transporter n=1 Tax=Pseudonocardia sp. GCM10023141 TaxID=3252653 RepID=UPI003605C317
MTRIPSPATYRWVVLAVLWLTLLVSYFDRVAIAAALPFMSGELHLSPSLAGVLSGALLLSYTIVQVPAGYLSDRFGQRRIIAAAIAWWTVFSVLTGVLSGSIAALLVVRFMMGVGEGFHPPPLWRVLSNWFEPGRRALPLALMLTALTLGPALAPALTFPIISAWGWRWVFYLTVIPGLLTVLLVLRWLRDSPQHANLTERALVANAGPAPRRQWWVPHIWLTFAAFFFFGFVLYGLMGWLPTYLITYRGLDLAGAGVLATAPYLAGTVGMLLGAWVCQRRFNHLRRRFIAVSYLATAACITATVLAPTVTVAGVFLTLSGFFLYSGLGPFWSVPMDIVRPHEVGMWLGFINMGTQLAGFLGPILIGALIQATGSFTPALVAMIGALVAAALCLSLVRTPVTGDAPAPAPAVVS